MHALEHNTELKSVFISTGVTVDEGFSADLAGGLVGGAGVADRPRPVVRSRRRARPAALTSRRCTSTTPTTRPGTSSKERSSCGRATATSRSLPAAP